MRASQLFIPTLKEAPAEAELISHQLMLRAGLIRRLGSGLYTWMPLGLRVLRRVEAVVREEMNRSGAQEVLMPAIIPAELWQETGRWDKFGPQMLKMKDRHERDFCFGPTHEEVISDIARREIRSYRQLPVNFYQIQTKFRDEIRPRFGVMRAREFIMKDAYSFHTDRASLESTYDLMVQTYQRIFTRLGLKFRAVSADTGAIGGYASQEFHVLADSGEDALAFCPHSDYAANVELAEALAPTTSRPAPSTLLTTVSTPGITTCEAVAKALNLPLHQIVKSLLVMDEEQRPHLLLLRGDHTLNEVKTEKLLGPFRLASDPEITQWLGPVKGFVGPVGLPSGITLWADRAVPVLADFVCGANQPDAHLIQVNFGRDLPEPERVVDLRNVVAGDPSPDGQGYLELARGIEVGHVFQLGARYSEAMGVHYLDEEGHSRVVEMGCYGIGVSRIVAAAIEQHHDARGICFPPALAPFQISLIALGPNKSPLVREMAERLYTDLLAQGVEVLFDDRDERLGVMLADQELMGIPWRIVVGERNLKNGHVEIQGRLETSARLVSPEIAVALVVAQVDKR
ncbi:proline--tRNA ligase [Ferrovum myxofaciens]|uniref:Proline--tRNA ligase n=1 Tax=Ferrovum myxofaciens TaxID=416213 RepID=A0A149VZ46_9PROT|nr:proline--tRNA ligase [Ferrovum myxofaciens]KXW58491.1 proline--tRNA ligase [Ferrovum myxofaciens]